MSKFYFCDENDERCYRLQWFKDDLEIGDSIELTEAEMEIGTDHFYCNEYMEVGLKGEGCGKECESYSPRNGKNGRCKHSKNCYTHSDKKFTLTKIDDKRFKLTNKLNKTLSGDKK